MSASASRARELLLELDADLLKRSVITPDFEKKEVAPPINQSRFALQKLRKVSWQHYSAVGDTVDGYRAALHAVLEMGLEAAEFPVIVIILFL